MDAELLVSFFTLTCLEIILGVDNLVLISVVTEKLPIDQQKLARRIGLVFAFVGRVGLLFGISALSKLTSPLFTVLAFQVSGRDLILAAGGLFLIAKATTEIFHAVELTEEEKKDSAPQAQKFWHVIALIVAFDLIFSIDSVLTAIGMVENIWVIIASVLVSIIVMIIFVNKISDFIAKNPTLKILALSFLVLIGVLILADGLHHHVKRGYVYFAMAFSLFIELLNRRRQRKLAKARQEIKSNEHHKSGKER